MIAHGDPVSHAVAAALAVAATVWYVAAGGRRLTAWGGAIAATLLSTSPPVERLAEERFVWHMVQHLGLIVVAAPLFVLSEPGRAFGRALPRPPASWRRSWRALGPLAAAGAFVAVLVVTHLTPLYDRAIRDQFVHDLEHALYLGSAIALWATARSARQHHAVRRVAAVFAVIGGTALLGVVLLTAPRPLIDSYEQRLGTGAALDDQRAAAALMWTTGMFTTLPLLVAAFWRWAASEQRAAERAEALLDRPAPARGQRW